MLSVAQLSFDVPTLALGLKLVYCHGGFSSLSVPFVRYTAQFVHSLNSVVALHLCCTLCVVVVMNLSISTAHTFGRRINTHTIVVYNNRNKLRFILVSVGLIGLCVVYEFHVTHAGGDIK